MVMDQLNIFEDSFESFVKVLEKRVLNQVKTFVVTANPVIVNECYRNPRYLDTIRHADFISADGIGVVHATRSMGRKVTERITGFDLMLNLLELASIYGWKVYLLGSHPHLVKQASINIINKFPGLILSGYHHGYFKSEDNIIQEIKVNQPDLIFVAMGCPKQEEWIFNHLVRFEKGLFVGVGGSIDVLSGRVKRAPKFWIKYHLEWLFRMIQQPKRIVVVAELLSFAFHMWKEYHYKLR